jgi:hypothetical protein
VVVIRLEVVAESLGPLDPSSAPFLLITGKLLKILPYAVVVAD